MLDVLNGNIVKSAVTQNAQNLKHSNSQCNENFYEISKPFLHPKWIHQYHHRLLLYEANLTVLRVVKIDR